MALTGQLTSPDIKMSLELPNERDEVQALVRNYIPTDEQMNMQLHIFCNSFFDLLLISLYSYSSWLSAFSRQNTF